MPPVEIHAMGKRPGGLSEGFYQRKLSQGGRIMHRQLRRTAIVSTSAAMLLGIAGIQAGIAQAAALGTSAPSPVLISHQTSQPVSESIAHMGLATPLAISSAPRPADSGNDNGNANQDNANQDNANQDNANQDNANQDNANQDNANQDNANQDNANRDNANQKSKDKKSKDKKSKDKKSKDKKSKDKESKDKESGSTSLSGMPVL
jgi:hypothetical protein